MYFFLNRPPPLMLLCVQGTKGKDVYESKSSLASRIVNTERQVDCIEEKLQLFIDMYEEDRKRLNAFTYAVPHPPPCTPCPDTPISAVSPPAGMENRKQLLRINDRFPNIGHALHFRRRYDRNVFLGALHYKNTEYFALRLRTGG